MNCKICGIEFHSYKGFQIYCSKKCNLKSFYANHPEKRREYALKTYLKHRRKRIDEQKTEKRKEYMKEYHRNNKVIRHELAKHRCRIRSHTTRNYREKLLEENQNCGICNSDKNLQIHHDSYIGDLNECNVICKNCHCNIHSKYGTEVN